MLSKETGPQGPKHIEDSLYMEAYTDVLNAFDVCLRTKHFWSGKIYPEKPVENEYFPSGYEPQLKWYQICSPKENRSHTQFYADILVDPFETRPNIDLHTITTDGKQTFTTIHMADHIHNGNLLINTNAFTFIGDPFAAFTQLQENQFCYDRTSHRKNVVAAYWRQKIGRQVEVDPITIPLAYDSNHPLGFMALMKAIDSKIIPISKAKLHHTKALHITNELDFFDNPISANPLSVMITDIDSDTGKKRTRFTQKTRQSHDDEHPLSRIAESITGHNPEDSIPNIPPTNVLTEKEAALKSSQILDILNLIAKTGVPYRDIVKDISFGPEVKSNLN